MIVTVDPEHYSRPQDELQARWRAQQLRKGAAPDEFHVESNILGLCGELAVLAYVRDHLPGGWRALHLADSSTTNSDISLVSGLTSIGLEVKTTDPVRFARYGRIVSEDQIYRTDAAAYVWCLAPRSVRRPAVSILGWSATQAVKRSWASPEYANSRPEATKSPHSWETFEDWSTSRVDRMDYEGDGDDYEHLQSPRDHAVLGRGQKVHFPTKSPANLQIPVSEGAEPLPGFVREPSMARVTADIRDITDLVVALTQR